MGAGGHISGPLGLGVAALVSFALGAAGCGGGSTGSHVAQLSTSGRGSSTAAKYKAALAYVDCMRSHGVPNFPDPTSDGQINVNFASGGKDGAPASSGIDRMSPRYISADQTCRHLLPGGAPTPAQNQQALAKELKFAQCMRSHDVPNFPDPTNAGVVHLIGVDQNSPRYQSAQKACEARVPRVDSK
jgi:hypothetical protein